MESPPFAQATALTPHGEDSFVGEIPFGWSVSKGAHGGLVAALLTRAAELVAGPDRPLRSLTTHFVRPALPGPISIEVIREREGSRLTSLSLRMKQNGETVAAALAAGGPDRDSFQFADIPMPDVPPPEEIAPVQYIEGVMPAFMAHTDFRPVYTSNALEMNTTGEGTVGGWVRVPSGLPLEAPAVAFLSDVWWPAVFAVLDGMAGAPTIDLTVHFRSPLPPANDDGTTWVLGRFRTHLVEGGHFEEDGVLWHPDGTVIAQSRQLALVLPLLSDAFNAAKHASSDPS